MRSLIFVFLFLVVGTAFATEQVLIGKTVGGHDQCTLTVENFGFAEGKPEEWWALTFSVKSGWQLEGNPAMIVNKAETPYTLFGFNKGTYDRVSINLKWGTPVTVESIQSYQFQTWDEQRGLVQKSCRFF